MKKILISSFFILAICLLGSGIYGKRVTDQVSRSCQPAGEFITIGEKQLHYLRREGGEIPVVFLHGASSNALDWQHSLFAKLDKRLDLIAIDRPGQGHSTSAHTGRLADQLETLHRTIAKLSTKKPIIVAHSLAGALGARLLTDYPAHYRGLILVAGAVYPIGDGSSWYTTIATMPIIGQIFRYGLIPALAPSIAPAFIQKSFFPQQPVENYRANSCLGLLFGPDRFLANSHDLNQVRPFLDTSYPLYSQISAPVSLIYGDQDQVIYQFSHAGGFKQKVAHAKYIMLPDNGHLPHFFQAELIEEEIDRIVKESKLP